MILVLTPLILFYVLVYVWGAEVLRPFTTDDPAWICFIILISGPAALYAVYWVRNKFFSKNIEFDDIVEDRSEEGYSVEHRSGKRKKSGLLNILSRNNKCDHCGTEMEYREEMDCNYCPNCREYK